MLDLIDGDVLPVADFLEEGVKLDILAMADIGLRLHFPELLELDRFRIVLLDYESGNGEESLFVHTLGLYPGHIGEGRFLEHLLDSAFSELLAVVIHEEYLRAFRNFELDREEEGVLPGVISEYCEARTLAHALHAADTLAVVDCWGDVGRSLGDGALRAGE